MEPSPGLMKTRVVLKSDHLHKADIDAVRLMKTRVVLKLSKKYFMLFTYIV